MAKARQRMHAGEITTALDTRPWFLAPLQTRDGAQFIGYSSTLQERATPEESANQMKSGLHPMYVTVRGHRVFVHR